MMKIVDYLNSKDFVDAVGINKAPLYRKHFQDIIQKAGVEDASVDDEDAILKINQTFSWSWFNFLFGFFWASYRRLHISFPLHVAVYGSLLIGFIIEGLMIGVFYLWPHIMPYLAQYFGLADPLSDVQMADVLSSIRTEFNLMLGGIFLVALLFFNLIFGLAGRSLFLDDLLKDYRERISQPRNAINNLILSVCLMIGALGACYYDDVSRLMQNSLSTELASHLPSSD